MSGNSLQLYGVCLVKHSLLVFLGQVPDTSMDLSSLKDADEFSELPVDTENCPSISADVSDEEGGSKPPKRKIKRSKSKNGDCSEKKAKMCPYCFIPTANINYADHFVEAHPDLKFKAAICIDPFKCPSCPYETRVKDTFQRHLFTHGLGDSDKVLRYKCPDCDMRFANPYSVDPHRHKVHGAEKAFECNFCGQKFSNKLSVKGHVKEKHSDSPKQRVCEHCGDLVSAARYADHFKAKHWTGPKKTYHCSHCPVSYKTSFALRYSLVNNGSI